MMTMMVVHHVHAQSHGSGFSSWRIAMEPCGGNAVQVLTCRHWLGEGEHANPQVLEPLTLPVAFGLGFNCKSRRLQPRPPRAEPLPEGLGCKFLPDFVSHAAASMPLTLGRLFANV